MFSNTWAVRIRGGSRAVLETLARKHGFVNTTKVSGRRITYRPNYFSVSVCKREQRLNGEFILPSHLFHCNI